MFQIISLFFLSKRLIFCVAVQLLAVWSLHLSENDVCGFGGVLERKICRYMHLRRAKNLILLPYAPYLLNILLCVIWCGTALWTAYSIPVEVRDWTFLSSKAGGNWIEKTNLQRINTKFNVNQIVVPQNIWNLSSGTVFCAGIQHALESAEKCQTFREQNKCVSHTGTQNFLFCSCLIYHQTVFPYLSTHFLSRETVRLAHTAHLTLSGIRTWSNFEP